MNTNSLNEIELAEVLEIAQNGEIKLRKMSDYATIMAEKWRIKTDISQAKLLKKDTKM